MALADTAKLVASLELQDKFSANAAKFDRTVGQIERRTARLDQFGNTIGRGIGSATRNIALLGAAGATVIVAAVKNGIAELEKLESATAQTNAVIESTGGVAGQTAESIRLLAEKYEGLNALIDDKVIQSGENLLLTFTSINKDAFEPALQAALDMNTAMGGGEEGLQNTIIQVGKALQDPIRGLTALRRVGVNFTEDQKKQIKRLVESNDLFGAQQVILQELSKEFGGSFAAAGDTAAGKFAKLRDAVDDAEASLATALLPVLGRVADKLSTFLSDPKTIAGIETFGQGLADGFDKVVSLAGKVPWETIGSSLQLAGAGAKAVLDAFVALPDWVQTAVLTGWGLNKLTGGALTSLFGQGISLIFERGASPANPLWVQSVGGIGGPGGGPTPGGGKLPLLAAGGAAAVGAAGTLFSQGSNTDTGTQTLMVSQAAHKFGATVDDVLSTGATLAAIKAFTDDPALRVGVPPELLAGLDNLADQLDPKELVSEFKKSRATSEQLKSLYTANTEQARLTAQRTSDVARYGQAALGPLGTIAAKDTSVTVSTVVNVTNSATQITQSVRRLLTANATRLTDAGVGL